MTFPPEDMCSGPEDRACCVVVCASLSAPGSCDLVWNCLGGASRWRVKACLLAREAIYHRNCVNIAQRTANETRASGKGSAQIKKKKGGSRRAKGPTGSGRRKMNIIETLPYIDKRPYKRMMLTQCDEFRRCVCEKLQFIFTVNC